MPEGRSIGRWLGEHEADARPVRVADVMTRQLVTTRLEHTLREARATMRAHGIHHLLVEDRGRVVAIISDRDVNRGLSPGVDTNVPTRHDEETLRRRVFQVATFNPTVIQATAAVEDATAVILERGISALPVVGDAGDIVGIITTRDLLRGLLSCVLPPAA